MDKCNLVRKPTLLVTGFEPFGNSTINPSQMLLEHLTPPEGWSLSTTTLPVESDNLGKVLEQTLSKISPNLIFCLGEARGETRMRVELWAQNLLNFGQPDNIGNTIRNRRIETKGLDFLFSGLCPNRMLQVLINKGISTLVSEDAGAYLCNQLFYTLSHQFRNSKTAVGFLHLPSLPEQNFGPGMHLQTQVTGVQALLDEFAESHLSEI